MVIIGIDPGIYGAVAIVKGDTLRIYDTPFFEVKGAKSKKTGKEKTKRVYDEDGMAEILRPYILGVGVHCFIEKVGPMPKEGVVGAFSFGCGWGIWRGILAAHSIPRTFVVPQMWKKKMMEGISDKDAARMRACQLFPQYTHLFAKKKDVDRADAALIAKYGQMILESGKA